MGEEVFQVQAEFVVTKPYAQVRKELCGVGMVKLQAMERGQLLRRQADAPPTYPGGRQRHEAHEWLQFQLPVERQTEIS
jgi:hypothetical protein